MSSHGKQSVDPPAGRRPRAHRSTGPPRRSCATSPSPAPPPSATGGGTIFDEPVLVVNQKAKLIEINNEYAIYDQHGTQIGAVRQVGQSTAKKALRVLGSVDQFLTHKLQVVDMQGNVLLVAHPPGQGDEVEDHRPGRPAAPRSARSCSRT